jgi:phage tail sheath protein FI
MVQVTYPGVYVVEKPSGVHTITGVATSIAAFVGFTRKGEPNKAVFVTSFADFERSHGGLDRDSPVSYGVRQFFLNGGTQAWIVRVAIGFATAEWRLAGGTPAPVLDVAAASPGTWANDLLLSVDIAGVRNPDADFNLIVSRLVAGTPVVLETHRNLNLDRKSPQFAGSVVDSASSLVRVKRHAGLAFTRAGYAVSGTIAFPLALGADRTLSGTVNGVRPFVLALASGGPLVDITALVTATTAAIAAAGVGAVLAASSSNADGTGPGSFLKLTAVPNPAEPDSSSVVIGGGSFGGLAAQIHMGLANGGREFPAAAQQRPAAVASLPPNTTTGVDGNAGTEGDLEGIEADKSGIHALRDVDLFNLLLIPETFGMTGVGQGASLIAAAAALCEERNAFYIVDAPSNRSLADIVTWAGITISRNAATYFPPVRIPDLLDGMRLKSMAPSGTLAGVYARTDATRGVWKAPAGTDATLNGVVELAVPLSDRENGSINPDGVNALRSFPAYGRVAWGARTRRGADAQTDEYKYIPIRRLALFLKESLYRGTHWIVFEPNDEPLWSQIRLNLGAFMNGLFRQGAFQGKTPQEAFFVKCDKETTTQADRNLGIVNIVVGFAPLKPAEFVILTIQQIAGDLQ